MKTRFELQMHTLALPWPLLCSSCSHIFFKPKYGTKTVAAKLMTMACTMLGWLAIRAVKDNGVYYVAH